MNASRLAAKLTTCSSPSHLIIQPPHLPGGHQRACIQGYAGFTRLFYVAVAVAAAATCACVYVAAMFVKNSSYNYKARCVRCVGGRWKAG
jgi:hypothetical protein